MTAASSLTGTLPTVGIAASTQGAGYEMQIITLGGTSGGTFTASPPFDLATLPATFVTTTE